MGRRGVVAASQPLAALAGLDTLKKGGNAIDAAVAAAAVLTVVEPHSTGLGGDAFIMIYLGKKNELVGLNASGRSPYNIRLDELNARLEKHRSTNISGIYSVTVPGAVDGWATALEKYGKMDLAVLLEPAIYYAKHGFLVTERIARTWSNSRNKLSGAKSSSDTWLVDGSAPRAGDLFINKDLAKTLRKLAKHGRDEFYRGSLARAIVKYSNELDGFLTMKDLEDHTPTWVQPIHTDYKNYRLYELPPNGQGIAALEMLNILENVNLKSFGHNAAEYLHYLIEAKKLAYADLRQWVGDPEFNALPIEQLISKEYGRKQFSKIDPERAAERVGSGLPEHGDTVLLTVMDQDHNAVSFIYSIFASFGSGLTVPGTGITLQNRGALFSRRKGHVNVIEPHKRPFHTIIPAMVYKDGEFFMAFGVMGGAVQPQQHVQVFLNVVEFGMNIQHALEAPRINHRSRLNVTIEPGIDEATLARLEEMGHVLDRRTTIGGVGGAQGIIFDKRTGGMLGGSTPHKDGMAVAF